MLKQNQTGLLLPNCGRIGLLAFVLLLYWSAVSAQPLFPVKINNKWGLINSDGQLKTPAEYDAIGEFRDHGFAVMQKHGKTGLFDNQARVILAPRFEEVQVLDSHVFSVKDQTGWRVIHLDGHTILDTPFIDVRVLPGKKVCFEMTAGWGMVDFSGQLLTAPSYEWIQDWGKGFYRTARSDRFGLLDQDGKELLPAEFEEIRQLDPRTLICKRDHLWGIFTTHGEKLASCQYEHFSEVAPGFIQLFRKAFSHLFSLSAGRIISSGNGQEYYPFSDSLIFIKENRQLGVMTKSGQYLLQPRYREVQRFGPERFRVNFEGKWGILDLQEKEVLPLEYDYIAPLKESNSLVKQHGRFGICNLVGELVVNPEFERIHFKEDAIQAFAGNSLTLFEPDELGRVKEQGRFREHFTITIGTPADSLSPKAIPPPETPFVLKDFEWFYEPEKDRWGLRKLEDGAVQLDAVFDMVRVFPDLNLSLVGIRNETEQIISGTRYRHDLLMGIVSNETGQLVSDISFLDIRLRDFEAGYPLARCIFENGKHGLLLKSGTVLLKDFAYIGPFSEGVARMSMKGHLAGQLETDEGDTGIGRLKDYLEGMHSPHRLASVTKYDQEFHEFARLQCKDCIWGYLDTLGRIAVLPQFQFARNFVNGVGIVLRDGKWGAINQEGRQLIPAEFDDIHFLEKTNNKIIRIYKREKRIGLVDTLGDIRVNATFEEVGSFSEGKLAVRKNNFWGFADRNGHEVIPCRFRAVSNFQEGLAAVKLGNNWGFIDHNGDFVIPARYRRAGNFAHGLAWVLDEAGCGYINHRGEPVIRGEFEKAFDFQFGIARVVRDGEFGLIDNEGNYLLRPRYSEIGEFDNMGRAIVRYGNGNIRYGVINIRGELLTRLDFREIRPFRENMAAVKLRDGYGFIDMKGELVIPPRYSRVSDFSEGLVAVQENGQCGYLNTEGDWVVNPAFSRCLDFHNGKAVVYNGLKNAGLIDSNGRVIIEPEINRLLTFTEGRGLVREDEYHFYYITEKQRQPDRVYQKAEEFRHGVAVVKMEGKWGIINQKGIEIIPPKYDKIEQFEDGYARVRITGFNGLTDLKGEPIIQPDYEYISYAGDGLFRVEHGDKIGYFNQEGNWVWNLTE